ncbi:fused (3R)-hydroxyacyl-ACP dehydratase subunits HadA/HadB [Nocardia sp. XZ_19_385]|uniref:fused (3R)-hydroxyacyl-ACP dehydratase subunits HadA/HadB n=1 Tax=Nocardia sp. XZ_19_385 TaxID=2769488 RepID=UPI001E5E431B|nr:fused (3R)-hydroxyacyl-ACP dehydratase subunits HadA/HadB [Nocardia sp. XZ_19_385]
MPTTTTTDHMAARDAVAFDAVAHAHSIVGNCYRVGDYYEVGREKIREYALAVQDPHPVHQHESAAAEYGYAGLLAPPTFGSLLANAVTSALGEILVGYDLTSTMQTDQVLDFLRPVIAGDQLTSHISLRSFRQAFGGDLLVVENIVTNQRGEIVLTAQTSLVARSGPAAANDDVMHSLASIIRKPNNPAGTVTAGPSPLEGSTAPVSQRLRARAASSVSTGETLPSKVFTLTLGDLVHYAGVSGDANPIHWHDAAAELFGLDSAVAHGMLTMGMGAGYVTTWLGDPGALRQYCVRMTSPVYVTAERPSEIEYQGRVKHLDPDSGLATIALTAIHDGRKIFGRATATVQL